MTAFLCPADGRHALRSRKLVHLHKAIKSCINETAKLLAMALPGQNVKPVFFNIPVFKLATIASALTAIRNIH